MDGLTFSQCVGNDLRRSIVLNWHRNCWAITDDVKLACNIHVALLCSTGVNLGVLN